MRQRHEWSCTNEIPHTQARSYILTLLFSLIQMVALLWCVPSSLLCSPFGASCSLKLTILLLMLSRYFGSYVPGGVSTLRYGSAMVARQAASLLPV